jgi:hypothetical protein
MPHKKSQNSFEESQSNPGMLERAYHKFGPKPSLCTCCSSAASFGYDGFAVHVDDLRPKMMGISGLLNLSSARRQNYVGSDNAVTLISSQQPRVGELLGPSIQRLVSEQAHVSAQLGNLGKTAPPERWRVLRANRSMPGVHGSGHLKGCRFRQLAAKRSDAAGHQDAAYKPGSRSRPAWAPLSVGACPFFGRVVNAVFVVILRVGRNEADRRFPAKCTTASVRHSTRSHGPASPAGNFLLTAPPDHSARANVRWSAWGAIPSPSKKEGASRSKIRCTIWATFRKGFWQLLHESSPPLGSA